MKKVTHSRKSIWNLFRSKKENQEQDSHSETPLYPNYGRNYPAEQQDEAGSRFVESSVGREDPLHFYGPPPEPVRVEPPEWRRAGMSKGGRRGIRIDQPARFDHELPNSAPHDPTPHFADQQQAAQSQYVPNWESPNIVAQPDDNTIYNSQYNGQGPNGSAIESGAERLTQWVKSGATKFRVSQGGDRSPRTLVLRAGIVAAALIILLGGWLRFAGPSATADQTQSNELLIADSSLAILSASSQSATQNSVADGVTNLGALPAANAASTDGNAATVGDLIMNAAAADADSTADEANAPQAQTVAQALAAAPTFTPTPVPSETPTPLPTFTPTQTPTPTPIPTEEIPDEIPQVNLIGSILDELNAEADDENESGRAIAQVQRTATPTITPTPLPLSPGRLWSTFRPGPPAQTDHFWIGRPFFSSADTQIASTNYQFGSTASSRYRVHYGLDISNPMGTDVRAATTGQVIHAGPDNPILLGPYNNFYGNAVVIRLDRRLPVAGGELDVFVLYGHLNSLNVQVGDRVEPDDIVGFVGMRGIALGPHLHVEVRLGANTYNHIVNPYLWLEPVAGTGAIAVRLLTADGRTWRSARVSLLRYENGRSAWSRYIETYSDDGYLGPDPAWGENGAMGSLKPGTYQVISVLNGERVKAEVQVRAGETTFVELRSRQ